MRKYAEIKQHERLRVPQGWQDQERALVIQLERVFDDIYKRFGRLGVEDLGERLKAYLDGMHDAMVTGVGYNSTTQKLTYTAGGETHDVVAIATLDGNGKVPASQLPGYVDDVEEYADLAHFPLTGEGDKIYVAMDTGFTYRWSGSQYVRLNTYDPATQSASGLMSAADKTKLDGIEAGAQVNPGNASQSAAGLMSASDKTKLDGIQSGATATDVGYDSTNKKITKTVNGTTSDVVSVATIKSAIGSFTWGELAGK